MSGLFLQEEVVLVTGSSRGLGKAIAKKFHEQGSRVIINYLHNQEAAEKVARRVKGIAIKADVTDLEQVKALFDAAEKHYGSPPTIIVNNALTDFKFNGDARNDLASIQWTDFDKQIRSAVQGALNTTKAALPSFERRRWGRIINIGSNLVQNPVVPYLDYCAAKGALLAFTRATAAELGPKRITCNMVTGGLLNVTDASRTTPKEVFEQIAAVTPLRRVTRPEDVAGAVLFLASAWAEQITGQQICVDGGLVMN